MGAMTCGLVYGTKLQISEVEDWLDDNCTGDWELALADLDTGGAGDVKKKIELYFELPADRDLFKNLFVGFEKGKMSGDAPSPSGSGGDAPTGGSQLGGMMRPNKG